MNAPDYLPFEPGPYRMTLGLKPLDLGEWIEIDDGLGAILRQKRRLLAARHDAVFQAVPGSEAAGGEVVDLLWDHLPQRFPAHYPRMGATLSIVATAELLGRRHPGLHPLDLAARVVPEDLCLLEARGSTHVLTAASVCFPSRWRLADKIGRSVRDIHRPVPGYDDAIGAPVDQFFARLAPSRLMWRLNWTLLDRGELFQPDPAVARDVPPGHFADGVILRVERQTLRRLPQSGAVLFTIRTYVRPLGALPPDARARLGQAVEALPPAMRAYRGLTRFADDLARWLISGPA